jgi:hypothetical protein
MILVELPALDALTADFAKVTEGVRLVRVLQSEIGPEFPPEYEAALTPETRKAWIALRGHLHFTPLGYDVVLKHLPLYRQALEGLEALWSDLGPYIKTRQPPNLTYGQGLIRAEVWQEVARYFNFDDSE